MSQNCKKMDFSAALKICLVFCCFSLATSLVASYFVVGILISKAISILTGILLLLLTGYLIFFIIKSEKIPTKLALYGLTAVLALAGGLTCFARTKLITVYDKTPRFFLALFVSLGVYEVIAFVWPQLILKIFSTFVQAFDADFLQIISFALNAVFAVICSLFLMIPTVFNENFYVQKVAVLTIASIVINTAIGSLTGFLLQFKAESGYTSQI